MSADKPDTTRTHETDFAAVWSSDGVTRSLAATALGLPADLPFLFSSGERFGPYSIVRPLGKGGMGQVYEAEEIDSGRRVAIKLLSRGLGDEEERERFLREGQLAASLSHPNCVYVFGTSEVQGFPVIAMELAPAGTLKDLVDPAAPMPVETAVDAMLQVIAGLDAASAIGILHRDVKPSNCFLDRDGRVMIGDFGLSIASGGGALERGVLGTPGFASPEQLNGAPLDVRSDIYSVGATLYYLLAGRTPFDTTDLPSMMTRIAVEAAPAITGARPDISGRLGAVIAKCLANRSQDRYANYAALAAALEPFRTMTQVPAPLGRRALAGLIDSYAAALPLMPINILLGQQLVAAERSGNILVLLVPTVAASVAYYTFFEGLFGCGAGKATLNLRVVNESMHPAGFKRALLRALAFIVPTQLVTQGVSYLVLRMAGGPATGANSLAAPATALAVLVMTLVCLAVLFVPARRRNGYAALHDRASRTRVVVRPRAIEARDSVRGRDVPPAASMVGAGRIGPFLVSDAALELARTTAVPVIVDGYDDRLRRGVWIELLSRGAPPVAPWRRDLNRPGRTRWISGRRSESESWDAYEKIEGQGLHDAAGSPQPWSRVRHWLADVARELAAASRDASAPAFRRDRVWIGHDERTRLLDWAPPSSAAERSPTEPNAQTFLYSVAVSSLLGSSADEAASRAPDTPLPLGARALLLSLREGSAGPPDGIAEQSAALLRDAAVYPRNRRLLQLSLSAAVPVMMVMSVFATVQMQVRARTADPAAFALKACLNQLANFDKIGEGALTPAQREHRDLLEIYIAEHLREPAEETASYARAFPMVANLRRDYLLADRALTRHPQRSPEQVARAGAVIGPAIARNTESLEALSRPLSMAGLLGLIAGGSLCFVALLAIVGALFTTSGFTLRGFGAALVTANGAPATRWRAVARALAAWSPLLLWFVVWRLSPSPQNTTLAAAAGYLAVVAIFVLGAVYAWRNPSRGIQDRIAGTWIVPR